MRRLQLAAGLFGVFVAGNVEAQEWDPVPLSMYAGTIAIEYETKFLMSQINQRSRDQIRRAAESIPPDITSKRSSDSSGEIETDYVLSIDRRKSNLARFVERSRPANPQGAAAMERLFASADVIAAMTHALAPVGLRTNDVADAYTVWWMSAWQAAHGDASTPSRAKAQAVRAQAARALAATPEFTQADDAAKQEFAEALLVQTALIDGMMERYGSDPAMAPKIAASVRQGARASGLDLDAMTLTEQGFVPAR